MSPLIAAFRDYARRYSIAVRRKERAWISGTVDERDAALDEIREIEADVERHMILTAYPAHLAQRNGQS